MKMTDFPEDVVIIEEDEDLRNREEQRRKLLGVPEVGREGKGIVVTSCIIIDRVLLLVLRLT